MLHTNMHFEEELESDAKNSTPIFQQISILDCILQELSLCTNEALQIWIRPIVLYIFFRNQTPNNNKKKLYQFIFQLPTLLLLSTATMEIKSFWHLPFRSSQLQLKLILPLLLLPPPTLQCQPEINKAENFVKMSCSKQHLKMQQQQQ